MHPTTEIAYLHPGKAAEIRIAGQAAGVVGELHPIVKAEYDLGQAPVLVAEFALDALRSAPAHDVEPVPEFPPILEDIAVILDELIPAVRVSKA